MIEDVPAFRWFVRHAGILGGATDIDAVFAETD
jgi:hypothetical protein